MKPIRRVFAIISLIALAAGAAAFLLPGTAGDALAYTSHVAAGPRYAIVYEANGGRGVVVGDVPLANEAVAIKDGAALSRAGWVFAGWNTEPDGTGTAYQPGETVRGLARPDETATLYAQWILEAS